MKNLLMAMSVATLIIGIALADELDLFQAARTGNIETIVRSADSGESLDVQDVTGYTPLILAAYNHQTEALQVLLDRGANPCLVDFKGQTALMSAAYKGFADEAQTLASRCDVNMTNQSGKTALMLAALFGHQEVAKLLLSRGANPEIADKQGNTAISLAKEQGNKAMVQLLKQAFIAKK